MPRDSISLAYNQAPDLSLALDLPPEMQAQLYVQNDHRLRVERHNLLQQLTVNLATGGVDQAAATRAQLAHLETAIRALRAEAKEGGLSPQYI